MAEFKKLSDVEVVAEPTESANVLIEEDGVIKKAPKTAVGGGAGNFVIVSIPHVEPMDVDASDIIEGATCNKTYDEVIEMYCAGEIDCAFIKTIGTGSGSLTFMIVDQVVALNEEGIVYIPDPASVECVGFTNYNMDMTIYYYRNGLSYVSPIPQPV